MGCWVSGEGPEKPPRGPHPFLHPCPRAGAWEPGGVTLQSRGVCSLPPFKGHTFWNRAKDLCLPTLWEGLPVVLGG